MVLILMVGLLVEVLVALLVVLGARVALVDVDHNLRPLPR